MSPAASTEHELGQECVRVDSPGSVPACGLCLRLDDPAWLYLVNTCMAHVGCTCILELTAAGGMHGHQFSAVQTDSLD